MTAIEQEQIVPFLIGGQRITPQVDQFTNVHNPSTGEIIAYTPMGTAADVDAAVQAAAKAFPSWSKTPALACRALSSS